MMALTIVGLGDMLRVFDKDPGHLRSDFGFAQLPRFIFSLRLFPSTFRDA
jgi:hypothetical protein